MEGTFLNVTCSAFVETKTDADVRGLVEGGVGWDVVKGGGEESDVGGYEGDWKACVVACVMGGGNPTEGIGWIGGVTFAVFTAS